MEDNMVCQRALLLRIGFSFFSLTLIVCYSNELDKFYSFSLPKTRRKKNKINLKYFMFSYKVNIGFFFGLRTESIKIVRLCLP